MEDSTAVPSKPGASTQASGTHTPGPWRVIAAQYGMRIYSPPMGSNALGLRIADTEHENAGNEAANARLIAAAPDLLYALRLVQRGFQMGAVKAAALLADDPEAETLELISLESVVNAALTKVKVDGTAQETVARSVGGITRV